MTFVTLGARFCDLQRGVVGEEAAIVSAILPSRDVGTIIIVRRATQSRMTSAAISHTQER